MHFESDSVVRRPPVARKTCRLPKTRNRSRRVRILPARVPKERSTMLARAASSGGGTRDSPSGRRPSRIKMLTPEEDKELQVRAVPSAMRAIRGVLKIDAQSSSPPRSEARDCVFRIPPARSRASRARGSTRARGGARPPSFASRPSRRSPPFLPSPRSFLGTEKYVSRFFLARRNQSSSIDPSREPEPRRIDVRSIRGSRRKPSTCSTPTAAARSTTAS